MAMSKAGSEVPHPRVVAATLLFAHACVPLTVLGVHLSGIGVVLNGLHTAHRGSGSRVSERRSSHRASSCIRARVAIAPSLHSGTVIQMQIVAIQIQPFTLASARLQSLVPKPPTRRLR